MAKKKVVLVPVKLMVPEKELQYWEKSLKQLKCPVEFHFYAKYAIRRSVSLDLRSKEKRWQKFWASPAVQKVARRILKADVADNLEMRFLALKSEEEREGKRR